MGRQKDIEALPLAIHLNRVDALSQLGKDIETDRELQVVSQLLSPVTESGIAKPSAAQLRKWHLVNGYVAARRNDANTAEAHFAAATDGNVDDYLFVRDLELAGMYRRLRQDKLAEDHYLAAITTTETMRRSAVHLELRPSVLAHRRQPYVELIALFAEQSRGEDALTIEESLRARTLLDLMLNEGGANPRSERESIRTAQVRQIEEARAEPALTKEALLTTIGQREALVFFVIDEQTAWRGHILNGRARFELLTREALESAAAFRANMDDLRAAEQASRQLLPEGLSGDDSPLYVVANGKLADLPFAALRWHDRFLIEARPVTRLHGLAALQCTTRRSSPSTVILGDPGGDLPGARREAKALARRLHEKAFLGDRADRSAVKQAHGARELHVATHTVDGGRALALADGPLTAQDVLELKINPDLAFLAGCITSASSDPESWDGLPSAFLAAGSHNVIATLRSVNDEDAERVSRFYYAQADSLPPFRRLAATQRELILLGVNVSAWASFVAWGDDACDSSENTSTSLATDLRPSVR
jgi:CHAT domain-containing protein